MKIVLFILGILLVVVLFMWNELSKTTWGGWKPPSTELKLTDKELSVKQEIEKKYNCKFTFIGLDDAFMEDSIIYMNINCNTLSELQHASIDSLKGISEKISLSFFYNSKERIKQTCIYISFGNIYYNESGKQLKYSITKKIMYNLKTKQTMEMI